MYSVSVRDHFMIAHSFKGEVFGPAQRLHGATYIVDSSSVVPTRCRRHRRRHRPRDRSAEARPRGVNFRNLDDEPAFEGHNTTTEFLARELFDRVVAAIGTRRTRSRRPRCRARARDAQGIARGVCVLRGRGVRQLYVVIPGDLETRTGGYGYDRRMIAGLRGCGWRVDVIRLDESFPTPTTAARAHAMQALDDIPDASAVLVDGLALGALPEETARAAPRLKVVGLVHHPLAAETGISPALASALEASERRALAVVRFVVVTSRATARRLADYDVQADRIAVVEPGTDPAPLARGSAQPSTVTLLCVASLTPRKGYELLLNALAAVPARNWQLTCAGSLDRDAGTVSRVRALLRRSHLDDRVSLAGDLDASALAEQYDRARLSSSCRRYTKDSGWRWPKRWRAGCRSSAPTQARFAISSAAAPASSFRRAICRAFTHALSRVIGDAGLRFRLSEAARRVRERLPTWDTAAAAMSQVLEGVTGS